MVAEILLRMEKKVNYRRRKTDAERREHRIKKIKQRYSNLKVIEFTQMDKVNMTKHFNIPKEVISKNTSNLALVVYPVLCSRADFEKDDWLQISLNNICKLTGLSEPSVRKGINDLLKDNMYVKILKGQNDFVKMYLLKRKKVTKQQRHFYMYKVRFLRNSIINKGKGGFINLQSLLFDTGIWAHLSKRAKLLYLALRRDAKFDPEIYCDVEKIDLIDVNNMSFFERGWDVCHTHILELCHSVNISTDNIKEVIGELTQEGLIESDGFMVYHIPKSLHNKANG